MSLPKRLPITLRTRLFLSISALITVALFGLLLGLIGMLQMAGSQQQILQSHFRIIEVTQELRQNLGNQLTVLLQPTPDLALLEAAQQQFSTLLADVRATTDTAEDAERLDQIRADYDAFLVQVQRLLAPQRPMPTADGTFNDRFRTLRGALVDAQERALTMVREEGQHSRDNAETLASLLAVLGLMVLVIGFLTAHNIARRFVGPIEKLAKAADSIAQGNFRVALPISPIAELSLLSNRFGVMATALQQFNEINIAAIQGGQRRLQAVLDCIDDGLLIIDRDGRLEHANPVAQRQLAWDKEQLGLPLGEALQHPELDEALRQVVNDRTLEDPQEDLVLEIAGEQRLVAWRLIPVSQPDGEVEGAVMVLRDVTDQRAFERVRNEFVLRASHELRTPVTGMHMAFGLLRERLKFAEGSREFDLVDTVDEEMRRLVRLINDLLNFSRYQSGQQKLELSPCRPDQLLIETRDRFANAAEKQDIELLLDLDPDLPQLNLDLTQMERVFDNLVTNAMRHTSEGGRICLQARRHGDRVILSVEDSGEGIPYGEQARIFEPFVQVGRKKGGAGLGLALCKEITRLHGGRIGIHSRLEHGTIVYLALPI